MNRGNLAEDPREGLSSSSRYARGAGKNALIHTERKSSRKGNHNSTLKKSVGSLPKDSHGDRLEVGMDGRLFRVMERVAAPEKPLEIQLISVKPKTPKKKRKARAVVIKLRAVFSKTHVGAAETLLKFRGVTFRSDALKKQEETVTKAAVPAQAITDAVAAGASQAQETEEVVIGSGSPTLAIAETAADSAGAAAPQSGKPIRSYLTVEYVNPLLSDAPARTRLRRKRGGSGDGADGTSGGSTFLTTHRTQLLAAGLAAAAGVYLYTGFYFRTRFYPGTEFFGVHTEHMSVDEAKAAVRDQVASYQLTLKTRMGAGENAGGNVISAGDVNLTYVDDGTIDRAMANQKSFLWPIMMLTYDPNTDANSLPTHYEAETVSTVMEGLPCFDGANIIAPENADVVMTDAGAVVQPEIYGTTLKKDITLSVICSALDNGKTVIDLEQENCYENPTAFSSDANLINEAQALNQVLGAHITLQMGTKTEVINSETIRPLLMKSYGAYTISEEKVRNYVAGLAEKYDTYQRPREFFTSIGTTVTLGTDGVGDYGWQIDQEATCEKILSAIRNKSVTSFEPVFLQTSKNLGGDDIGNTYVEINLTDQMMWFYKDGMLVVKTPVVTGNPYLSNQTPCGGVWSLKDKMRNQMLRGQGYNSPVDYWMPFNGGIGIHDMQNRAWFGGTVYLGAGSHGCINTPLAAVKLIYASIEPGVPIIVYEDESEEAQNLITDPTDIQTLTQQIEETYGTVEDDEAWSIVSWSKQQAAAAAANAASGTAGTANAASSGGVWQ